MDPENPVVKLCAEGMRAEAEGRPYDARALFQRAWELRMTDFDGCIAAHYLARHQDSAQDRLRWNQLALQLAELAGGEEVRGFFASLHLNLAFSHQEVGNEEASLGQLDLAEDCLGSMPDTPYRQVVRDGISHVRERLYVVNEAPTYSR